MNKCKQRQIIIYECTATTIGEFKDCKFFRPTETRIVSCHHEDDSKCYCIGAIEQAEKGLSENDKNPDGSDRF